MEAARRELISRLSAYLSRKDVQITVVFDGAGGLVDSEPLVPGRLQVLYSAAGQSADEVIVATLESHANPREFIVVTNDMADIGRAVRSVGANVMASAEFLARVGGTHGEAPGWNARVGEKPDPSEDDVEYWLRKFGGSDGGGKNGPRGD
jgi:predicted RNA-binding protein with PIN domain